MRLLNSDPGRADTTKVQEHDHARGWALLQGLRQAESQLDRVARRIAGVESQGPEADTVSISPEGLARAGGDHAADLVELRSTRLAFGANVRVLAGARDAEQDLIEILGR